MGWKVAHAGDSDRSGFVKPPVQFPEPRSGADGNRALRRRLVGFREVDLLLLARRGERGPRGHGRDAERDEHGSHLGNLSVRSIG